MWFMIMWIVSSKQWTSSGYVQFHLFHTLHAFWKQWQKKTAFSGSPDEMHEVESIFFLPFVKLQNYTTVMATKWNRVERWAYIWEMNQNTWKPGRALACTSVQREYLNERCFAKWTRKYYIFHGIFGSYPFIQSRSHVSWWTTEE